MNESERPKFAMVITALAGAFSKEADEPLLQGYWMGLEDLEISTVEQAAKKAIRSCKHFPRPAELRELANVSTPRNTAALAWRSVSQAAKASKPPDDALAAAVVQHMGGARRLGAMTTEELETWGRKEFERLYPIVAAEQKTPQPQLEAKTTKVIGDLAEKMEMSGCK